MTNSIFDYTDYRKFLSDWEPGRGGKTRLAEVAGCKLSYLSQVLGGSAHLNLEQAFGCCGYFAFEETEREFFLLLVHKARAGTPALRQFFDDKIRKALGVRQNLQQRLKTPMPLGNHEQSDYYSSWQFAAVHVATSLPKIKSAQDIALLLGIDLRRVTEILAYLSQMGLVSNSGGKLRIGKASVHLPRKGLHIYQHHSNWRLHAVRSLERNREEDLFYSSVVTLAREDFLRIKEALIKAIENAKAAVAGSPAEMITVFNLDFYGM